MTAKEYLKKPSIQHLVVNTLKKMSISNGDAENLLNFYAKERIVETLKNLKYKDGSQFLSDIDYWIPKDLK